MFKKTTSLIALMQVTTGLLLLPSVRAIEGVSCDTVGDRTCADCYIMDKEGTGWVAAVDGRVCKQIGEAKLWVYFGTFWSDETPLNPDGCDAARGYCSEWVSGGGGA